GREFEGDVRAGHSRHPSSVFGALGAARLFDEICEILRLAEITIHGRVADIAHRIEHGERLHHHPADRLRGDLALARALKLADDAGDHLLHLLLFDRPLAERDRNRTRELVTIERHTAAGALEHHKTAELHTLERREARPALIALTPTANAGAILRG